MEDDDVTTVDDEEEEEKENTCQQRDVFTLFDTSIDCNRCIWPFKTTMTCIYSNTPNTLSNDDTISNIGNNIDNTNNNEKHDNDSSASLSSFVTNEDNSSSQHLPPPQRRFTDGSVEITFRLSGGGFHHTTRGSDRRISNIRKRKFMKKRKKK